MQRTLLIPAFLLLAACSGPSDEPPVAEAEDTTNVIGAPLQKSLDKARSVEDLGGQRKGGLDEAVDEAN